MTDKKLFEKLKRDGECWPNPDNLDDEGICKVCGCCYEAHTSIPDFSTPDGFFWLWERAQEKEWWGKFLELLIHDYCIAEVIHPTNFPTALKRYIDLRCL